MGPKVRLSVPTRVPKGQPYGCQISLKCGQPWTWFIFQLVDMSGGKNVLSTLFLIDSTQQIESDKYNSTQLHEEHLVETFRIFNYISFTKENELLHVAKCGKGGLAPELELYNAWHRETHFRS